jgi:hypothetical protein
MRGEDGADLNEEGSYIRTIDGRQFVQHSAKTVPDRLSEISVAHFAVQITKILFVFQRNASDRAQATFHLKEVQGVHIWFKRGNERIILLNAADLKRYLGQTVDWVFPISGPKWPRSCPYMEPTLS